MATSCFYTSADMDWLWGTLKPWQILHSTLAERERCGNVMDVWELVNETILSASTTYQDPARVKEQEGDGNPLDGMRFLRDDLEYWKHGGVMEARVKEWLAMRDEEDKIKYGHASALTQYNPQYILPHAENHLIKSCINRQELALVEPSLISIAAAHHHVDHAYDFSEQDESEDENDAEEEEHQREEEKEEDQIGNDNNNADEEEYNGDGVISNGGNNAEEEIGHSDHTIVSYTSENATRENGLSLVVVNQCCTNTSTAGASAEADHQRVAGHHIWNSAKMAEGDLPHLEEGQNSGAVCPVCLEELDNMVGRNCENQYNTVDYDEGSVQELACRHAFHRDCISPWLQHGQLPGGHACCPCCRAPISTSANLTISANLEAPLITHNQQQPTITRADHAHDIMGLLADVEAALERLGFRS